MASALALGARRPQFESEYSDQLPEAIGEVKPVDRLAPSAFAEDRDEAGIEVYSYVHRK